ncbi:MAG: 1-acyl-sn-glycerol-3-phosphate acyltransferase [Patescibacteria group bacterium]|nr:1-acyl-sn-glycerol-3-phosphate acyltransferase [Patescibacteria group bacterium]
MNFSVRSQAVFFRRGVGRNNIWWVQKAVFPVVRALFFLLTRTRIQGKASARRIESGPVIIIANHKSYLDPLLVGLCFPYRSRLYPFRFIGRDSLFENRVRRFFFGSFGGFPALAGTGLTNSLRLPEEILSSGGSLVFFPEGKRVFEQNLGEFKIGIAKLAGDVFASANLAHCHRRCRGGGPLGFALQTAADKYPDRSAVHFCGFRSWI